MAGLTDYDLYLVIGIILCVLAVPALLSAISHSRAPRFASVALLIGGGLLAYALTQSPEGYAIADVPQVTMSVIGRWVN